MNMYIHLMSIHPSLRILLLAGMGLGALWMIHLLAQDFNRIRRPISKLVRGLIFKRDLDAVILSHEDKVMYDNAEVNWNRILHNDPLNCALSLVCQIAAGAEQQNSEAKNINAFVQYSVQSENTPKKVESAFKLGASKRSQPDICYKKYPHCPYSAKTMLKILDIHAYLFNSG